MIDRDGDDLHVLDTKPLQGPVVCYWNQTTRVLVTLVQNTIVVGIISTYT